MTQTGVRRVCRTLRATVVVGALLAALVDPAPAQEREEAIKARVAAIMSTLVDGSDAEFEALRDRCIVLDGRRMCPGSDREPNAPPRFKIEPDQGKSSGRPELKGSGTESAVTFVPGVRGDANTFTALEDLIRDSLEAGQLKEAARYARDLSRLVGQAAEQQVQPGALTAIGRALLATGQPAEADGFLRRALVLELTRRQRDLSGRNAVSPADALSMRMALMLSGLAGVAAAQERPEEARRLHRRALMLSADPDNVEVLKAFALFEWQQGRLSEATALLSRSVTLNRQFFGGTSSAADGENALGHLALAQGQAADAYRAFQRAAAISTQIALQGVNDPMFHQRGGDYVARKRRLFEDVVSGALRLAELEPNERVRLAGESFEAAQWAERTTAAAALSRMTARVAARDPELSRLVRDFDGLLAERQQLEKQLLTRLAAQDAGAANAARTRIAATEARAREIRATLAERFPKYAALAYPQPLSVAGTQALLRSDEALVQFLFTEDEGFAWLVTQAEVRAVKLPLAQKALAEQVSVLRCGLDSGEWSMQHGQWVADTERCRPLEAERNARKQLPFKPDVAHALYLALFGQLEDLIGAKSLLLVPSGALAALPLHVLVTAPPGTTPGGPDYRSMPWLALRHSLTVLPSAAALSALRQLQQGERPAQRPYIGFGNPLLSGSETKPEDVARAALARRKQDCPAGRKPAKTLVASVKSLLGVRAVLRGEMADVEALRGVPPLPETADELCAVGLALGAGLEEVLLGPRATERAVKSLSQAGLLKSYGVIHFATHGLLAGDTESLANVAAEPALLLTPPATPSEEDDGLLTASEIARLELAADWVILSACNTAAGGTDGEALSGLGRAFFYAGARALLVSHWPVYSDATVKLVTNALRRMAAHTPVGRSEALRQSMLALIATGAPHEAHPAYWAPFVVVGEGATTQGGAQPPTTSSIVPVPPAPAKATPPAKRPAKKPAPPDWRTDLWRQ